jgi:hypothetical protein
VVSDSFDLRAIFDKAIDPALARYRRVHLGELVEWLERRSQDPWNKVADLYEEAKQAAEDGSFPWEEWY